MRFTDKEFAELLAKNPKIKISSQIGGKNTSKMVEPIKVEQPVKEKKIALTREPALKIKKITFPGEEEETKEKTPVKKRSSLNVTAIIKQNQESTVEIQTGEDYFILGFSGAKLLSINQIFALLQGGKRKYQLFSYKKNWHEIIQKILNDQFYELKSKNQKLPFFNDSVELTLFLQAPRLVDEDASIVMFKFIIDALKYDAEDNPNGILAEDNKKIVHNIVNHSVKGVPYIGIKIKKAVSQLTEYTKEDLFKI